MIYNTISVKKLFVFVILSKIFSSLLGWFLNLPWILGFFLPLILMSIYIVIGINHRDRDELPDDKFADSCYYLGFIFTISSIIISLFDLPNIGKQEKNLGDIAIRFGAAMISTVIGLIIRVYLVNFKKDIHDALSSIEEHILEAEKQFHFHIQSSIEKLQSFSNTVDDASRQTISLLNQRIEDSSAMFLRKTNDMFNDIEGQFKKTIDESKVILTLVSDEIKKIITDTSNSAASDIQKISKNLVSVIEENSLKIDENTKNYNNKMIEYSEDLKKCLENLVLPDDYFIKELSEPIERLKQTTFIISKEIGLFAESIDIGKDKIDTSLNKLSNSCDKISMSMNEVDITIKSYEEIIKVTKELSKIMSTIINNTDELSKSTTNAIELLRDNSKKVSELAENVIGLVDGNKLIEKYAENLNLSTQSISDKISLLNGNLDKFNAELSGIKNEKVDILGVTKSITKFGDDIMKQFRNIVIIFNKTSNGISELSSELRKVKPQSDLEHKSE